MLHFDEAPLFNIAHLLGEKGNNLSRESKLCTPKKERKGTGLTTSVGLKQRAKGRQKYGPRTTLADHRGCEPIVARIQVAECGVGDCGFTLAKLYQAARRQKG